MLKRNKLTTFSCIQNIHTCGKKDQSGNPTLIYKKLYPNISLQNERETFVETNFAEP